MDFDKKIDLCSEYMAEEFGISSQKAYTIITYFDLEDKMIEYYSDKLKEAEEKQMAEWEKEIKMNPEIYDLSYNIHGGV